MNRIEAVARTLADRLIEVTGIVSPRPNEVHCLVPTERIREVGDIVCRELGADLILIVGEDRRRESGAFYAHYLFAHAGENWFVQASVKLDGRRPEIPSLAVYHYPASRFERELRDLFGFTVTGHPDPRPLVKHGFWPERFHPLRKDAAAADFHDDGQPFPFTAVGGEGVYEIPVGPVHAGVIEPGHFRFSVMGETIIDMKSRLYFTHKGTEKLFEGRAPGDGVELAERISGDTTVGHALAYCQAIESASGTVVPARARWLRSVLLELERLYNHVGDFGAIANDTGFAVANAHCLRIRERLLRLNKALTGSRLMRGVIAPGGLTRDLALTATVADEIADAVADFEEIVVICLDNTLVLDRLEDTGVLTSPSAREYGVVGFVARASGVDLDARRDHPFAAYGDLAVQIAHETSGDVKGRALVRVKEIRESTALIRRIVDRIERGPVRVELGRADPYKAAFGIVEAWRGRLVHWVMTTENGTLHRVKVVDPSFFNWPALTRALTGNIVPDFPLCNKSFNQSYSGNDL